MCGGIRGKAFGEQEFLCDTLATEFPECGIVDFLAKGKVLLSVQLVKAGLTD